MIAERKWQDARGHYELGVNTYDLVEETYEAAVEICIQELPEDMPDADFAGIDLSWEQVTELRDHLTSLLVHREAGSPG